MPPIRFQLGSVAFLFRLNQPPPPSPSFLSVWPRNLTSSTLSVQFPTPTNSTAFINGPTPKLNPSQSKFFTEHHRATLNRPLPHHLRPLDIASTLGAALSCPSDSTERLNIYQSNHISLATMDHLAVFDGFGSTSLDLSGLPGTELAPPSSYRSDKGKARARDSCDDDLQLIGYRTAESSQAGLSSSATSSSSSSSNCSSSNCSNCDHWTTRSANQSDTKGKARQQIPDLDGSGIIDQNSVEDARPGHSRRLRRPLTSSFSQGHQSQDTNSLSSSYHEDVSLKRSIRELSSSPSSSPQQHLISLPSVQVGGPKFEGDFGASTPGASASSSLQPTTGAVYTRPSTSNKKRRSNGANATAHEDDIVQASSRRQLADPVSNPSESSSALHPLASTASHLGANLQSGARDSHSGSRSHTRRASLLLNSSTSQPRSLDDNSTFCDSPEPMDLHPHFDESRHDLSQRRAAFLEEARTHRSSGTIRRRRGFYLRDADLLRNEPSNDASSISDRPSSAASDVSFMSDFARAVDLRLSARTESMRSSTSSLTTAFATRTNDQPSAPSQRRAPQLPYVRAASPLTIPFADHDNSSQYGGHLRRRVNAHQQPDRLQHTQQQDAPSSTTRRIIYDPDSWTSPPANPSNRSSGTSRDGHYEYNRHESLQRDVPRARESGARRPDPAVTAATSTASGRLDSWRHYEGQYVPYPLQSRSRDDTATADDFGAIRRPFGQQGTRATRRAFRSRAEDGSDARTTATAPELQRGQNASLRRETDRPTHRHVDETQTQRDSLPWRRTHFGLRTPSHHVERHTTATQPRFEPFAEATSSDSRRPTGLTGPRAASSSASLRQERNENESALEYLGRIMSHDSMLDEWMAGDVHGPLLRMAFESEVLVSNPHLRHLGYPPASTSTMFGHTPHLAFDARNFIADEDWAELNSYEGLMQLSERLGAADICVPQSLIDTLPTCEYGKWDGGSCRPRDEGSVSPPLKSKGKGKQKVESLATTRDTMCPICREDYLDSDLLMSINKCCHAFHADCIKVSTHILLSQ